MHNCKIYTPLYGTLCDTKQTRNKKQRKTVSAVSVAGIHMTTKLQETQATFNYQQILKTRASNIAHLKRPASKASTVLTGSGMLLFVWRGASPLQSSFFKGFYRPVLRLKNFLRCWFQEPQPDASANLAALATFWAYKFWKYWAVKEKRYR